MICSGKAEIVKDAAARHKLLNKFLVHFNIRLGRKPDTNLIPEEAAAGVGCVAISIKSMTGRKKTKKKK